MSGAMTAGFIILSYNGNRGRGNFTEVGCGMVLSIGWKRIGERGYYDDKRDEIG